MFDRDRITDRFAAALASPLTLWLLSLALGGLCAYLGRFQMNPDGLSYLDIASETRDRGPGELVSGYWSPGYPALIALCLALFRPRPEAEVPLVHSLNFGIFIVALWAFAFFLRSIQAGLAKLNQETGVRSPLFVAFGFAVFLFFSLKYIGVANVTPDLMIAALVFLAAGIVWRISTGTDNGLTAYVTLGAILGLGYLFKSVFFPLSLALIMLLFTFPPAPTWDRRKLLVAGLVLLLVCLPWAAAVSRRLGTLSIGEAGRLNYIWYANHPELTPYLGWDGGFGDLHSTLRHPPRMLMNNPVVMEFGSPLPGTHPLWYDPSYWWQGAKAEFVTAAQLAAVKANLHILFDWALQMGPLIVGALALLVIRLQKERQPGVQHILTWYWLWPLAACTLYLPVHVEPRFLGAFLAILWVGVYGYLLPNSPVGLRAAALVAVIAVLLLPFAATTTRAALASLRHPATPPDQIAATALRSLGLKPGDLLATVGVDFQPFYARRAHLRTVAYVEVPEGPWSLPAAQFDRVKECLASAGIQALVARGRLSLPNPQEWTEIDLPEAGKLQVVMLPASAHRP